MLGRFRMWAVAGVVVLVSGTCSEASAWSENRIPNGCRFSPNVKQATVMECDFKGIAYSRTSFYYGNLPSSLRTIRITNARSIKIAKDAFSNLPGLQSIHYRDIRSLRIEKNNMTNVTHSGEVLITVDQVTRLSLNTGAFIGWKAPGPKIVVKNVKQCNIQQSAFESSSIIQTVTIENISSLETNTGAFGARIQELALKNVSMRVCDDRTFAGRIGRLSLHSAEINGINTECLHAVDGWSSLSVHSSQLGDVMTSGISGRIANVRIADSNFTSVSSNGFRLNVSSFMVNTSTIGELEADALDVSASQSIVLQMSSIATLREHALRSLRINNRTGQTVNIEQLFVDRAEKGSLAFSARSMVALHEVLLREPCECDVHQMAFGLAFTEAPSRNITVDERQAITQTMDAVRCVDGISTPTLSEFGCRSCSNEDRGTLRCSHIATKESTVHLWVWAVVAVAVLVLLTVGAALALTTRQRALKRLQGGGQRGTRAAEDAPAGDGTRYSVDPLQGRQHSADPQCGGRPSADPDQEQPPAGPWQAARCGGHPSPVTTPESEYSEINLPLEEEPVYIEIDARAMEQPAVELGMYVEMAPIAVNAAPNQQGKQPVYANCGVERDQHEGHPLYVNCGVDVDQRGGQPVYENYDGGKYQ